MKYVIDIDALKNVLDVMHKPYSINGNVCVYLAEANTEKWVKFYSSDNVVEV